MAARTSKTSTPVDARTSAVARITEHALTLPTQAAIADVLGVSGKTVRGRSRAGTLKHADGNATPSFRASKEGQKPPTRVAEAIVFSFAPQDADACAKLADTLNK